MREFTSEDSFWLKGRGLVFTGIIPENWIGISPDDIYHHFIEMDGEVRLVMGIERFASRLDKPFIEDEKVGLLVSEQGLAQTQSDTE